MSPEAILRQANELVKPLEEFFVLGKEEKEKYQKDKLWGYNYVNHKQGIFFVFDVFLLISRITIYDWRQIELGLIPLNLRPKVEKLVKSV